MSSNFASDANESCASGHVVAAFGCTNEKAQQVGYQKELDTAIRGLREMHRTHQRRGWKNIIMC
jgi:hypothetical protein